MCPSQTITEAWDDALLKYAVKMNKQQTQPSLVIAIRREIMAWLHPSIPLPPIHIYPSTLQAAIVEQRQIGWYQFLEGLISTKWKEAQHEYHNEIGKTS